MVSGSMIQGNSPSKLRVSDIKPIGQIQNEKPYQASLTFMIQTEKEIAPWKKSTPLCTVDLNAFIAVKLVIKITGLNQTSHLQNQRL